MYKLTSLAAKNYNTLLLNLIAAEIREESKWFSEKPIPSITDSNDRSNRAKNLEVTHLFVEIWLHKLREEGANTSSQCYLKGTVKTIMMLYKNMKVIVRSPHGDTDFSDIVAGVRQIMHIKQTTYALIKKEISPL